MSRGNTVIIVLVTLLIGFGGGFVLRPVIVPAQQTARVAIPSPIAAPLRDTRSSQYFVANIDVARQVVAGCRDGSVRGGECATAEEAIIKVEAQERRKRFLGN
ncbi:Uncharacterised protein [Brevundimonas vesicularis]|uniref:Uncharacterized protein n=1 Tax=Brevundimonas vesicularis TaxID=41276 RepID=A0A2X1BVP7_BREVE|nr:hypothetical protein [Brevundimonas vesicularis]SPU54814.1 Uncharacterised protein [Brevundimonas vesicularis]